MADTKKTVWNTDKPMVALWKTLNADAPQNTTAFIMSIVQDAECGIEKQLTENEFQMLSILKWQGRTPDILATPLILAIHANRPDVVAALLAAGADLGAKDEMGVAALGWACHSGSRAIVEAVITHGVDRKTNEVTALYIAAAAEYLPILLLLLAEGASVDTADDEKHTPLHVAANENLKSNIQALLDNGADINVVAETGTTPLHLAALEGNKKAIEMLIAEGAYISLRDGEGKTPLDLFVEGYPNNGRGSHELQLIKLLTPHEQRQQQCIRPVNSEVVSNGEESEDERFGGSLESIESAE